MDTKEEVLNYVDTLAPFIRGNVDILTPDEIPGGSLYHIGTDGKIDKFIPRIPRRAAAAEDVTVPRVCTSNTVLGCLIGYDACLHDFFEEEENKGGWYIYKFDFDYALYANDKLTGDSSRSGEHWLVPYNKDRWEYKATIIGKIFFNSVRYFRAPESKVIEGTVEAYIQINQDEIVHWSKSVLLTEGYWRIEMDIPATSCMKSWRKHKHYVVEKIGRKDFMERKRIAASLLSIKESLPPSSSW